MGPPSGLRYSQTDTTAPPQPPGPRLPGPRPGQSPAGPGLTGPHLTPLTLPARPPRRFSSPASSDTWFYLDTSSLSLPLGCELEAQMSSELSASPSQAPRTVSGTVGNQNGVLSKPDHYDKLFRDENSPLYLTPHSKITHGVNAAHAAEVQRRAGRACTSSQRWLPRERQKRSGGRGQRSRHSICAASLSRKAREPKMTFFKLLVVVKSCPTL